MVKLLATVIARLTGSIPIVQIHFLVGQAGKPVQAKGRAGCPPHKKLFLQKWDAPD